MAKLVIYENTIINLEYLVKVFCYQVSGRFKVTFHFTDNIQDISWLFDDEEEAEEFVKEFYSVCNG